MNFCDITDMTSTLSNLHLHLGNPTVHVTHKRYWYALQVMPRRENKALLLLNCKGYESCLPTNQVRRTWSDRVKVLEQPLFPGYVFCRIHEAAFGLVLTTPGLGRFVTVGGIPCPISDDEICSLARVSKSGLPALPHPYFRVNQKVKVVSGLFAGLVGAVLRVENQRRLVVSVDAIERSFSIAIDEADVIPLERAHSVQ
jgi:transcription antitermination factor NusG